MATLALIVGGVGALATAGSAAYSAHQAANVDAGGIPEAALYNPVDYGDVQTDTLLDNYQNLNAIGTVSNKANRLLSQQDMRRANRFIPGFKGIMQTQANNVNNLVNGQLPYEDVLQIAGNSNQLAGAFGTPGTGAPGTLRDLGLSQLQGIQSGQGLLQGMVGIAEQVSPISRYSKPQDFLLTPSQTVPWEIQQQQLIQQSTQSANNLAAGVSPTQLAQNAAAVSGASNPYSSIGPALSSIGGAIGSYSMPPAGGAPPAGAQGWQTGPQPGTYYTPPGYRTSSPYSIPAA